MPNRVEAAIILKLREQRQGEEHFC